MKFGRSFFSLYFLIVSLFLVFTWLLDEAWSSYIEQDVESYTGYKVMLTAVGDYIQKHPEDQWEVILESAAKRYELPLSLTTLRELDTSSYIDHDHLEQGNTEIYYYDDDVILHNHLDNSEMILTLGPAKMPTRPRAEAFLRIIVFGFLGLIIWLWLWPMSKDLDLLKKAAVEFGGGNFETKAPHAQSSMMEPMVRSFNMMAGRIKRLIESHKELTNAVAHELRTPLARSKFALQMIDKVKDEEKKQRYIQQIDSDICELDELINEMLLYASFDSESPELHIERHDVNKMINMHLKQYSHYNGEIKYVPAKNDSYVEFDLHFIERALNNYITNAMKYGEDKIVITATIEDQRCNIRVEDNGKGVSDKFKDTVFDAFSRGDNSRNKETGGFGLGLAIVGRIMEWHHGAVNVADSNLGGASFSISWPVSSKSA